MPYRRIVPAALTAGLSAALVSCALVGEVMALAPAKPQVILAAAVAKPQAVLAAVAKPQTVEEAVAQAEATPTPSTGSVTGLPLPRFVSLKAGKVNMRIGPSQEKYPIVWSYQSQGLPVEIVQEYDNWRRIRDYDGTMGWVNAALLSGRRTALIAVKTDRGSSAIPLYAEPSEQAAITVLAEQGVFGRVEGCDGTWCLLKLAGGRGYIREDRLWGVYPHEHVGKE